MGVITSLPLAYQSVRHLVVTGVCLNVGAPPLGLYTYSLCMAQKKKENET